MSQQHQMSFRTRCKKPCPLHKTTCHRIRSQRLLKVQHLLRRRLPRMLRLTQARRNPLRHRLQSPPLTRKPRGHRPNPRPIAPQSLLCLLYQSSLRIPMQQNDHIVIRLSLRLQKHPDFRFPWLSTGTQQRQLPLWPKLLPRTLVQLLKRQSFLRPHHQNHGPTLCGLRLQPPHRIKLQYSSPTELVVEKPRPFLMFLTT